MSKYSHTNDIIQWNSVTTNSVINEHSVTTNRFVGQIGHLLRKLTRLCRTLVITNKNGSSQAVRYNRVWLHSCICWSRVRTKCSNVINRFFYQTLYSDPCIWAKRVRRVILQFKEFWCWEVTKTHQAYLVIKTPSFYLPIYSVFHQFRQAKFDYGGSILSSSQFSLLPLLPHKM